MFSNKPTQRIFSSLRKHNIKKRFNIWQEVKGTGTVNNSHLYYPDSLEEALIKAQEFQEFTDKYEQGKYTYHVDVEILIEDAEGHSLMEDGNIAYAITVFPQVNDFMGSQVEVW